jgi:hypothetical protein
MHRSIIASFLVLVLLVSAGLSVELVSARQLDQGIPADLTLTDTPPVFTSDTPSPTVPEITPESTATPSDIFPTPGVTETTSPPALTETPTTTSTPGLPDGYVEYRDDQYGFGFLYPTDLQPKSWDPAADILSSLSFHFGEYDEGEKSEISISVLANPDQLTTQEWIETHSPSDLADLPESLVNSGIIFENASSPNVLANNPGFYYITESNIEAKAFRIIVPQDGSIISLVCANCVTKETQDVFSTISASLTLNTSQPAENVELRDEVSAIFSEENSPLERFSAMAPLAAGNGTGYKLPWTFGNTVYLGQGWGNDTDSTGSHEVTQMYYAYDFAVPEGAPILAARTGTVTDSTGLYSACGGYDLRNLANRVTLSHDDGSSTLYLHLKSTYLPEGSVVEQGWPVGASGKTGWTDCYTHVHFQRQQQGIWITDALPIYFDEYPNQQLNDYAQQVSQNGLNSAQTIIDDADASFQYTGWVGQAVAGQYQNTEHYSAGIGNKVTFQFTGTSFKVLYRSHPSSGTMNVIIDGVSSGSINLQFPVEHRGLQWTSPTVSSGPHTVEFIHASGSYVTLDGLIIQNDVPVTPSITPTGTMTPTSTTVPPTTTPAPPYPYYLSHTGNFGAQTSANCRAIGYAKKIDAGTGTVYIRIYIDDVLRAGKYTAKGGAFNFDLLSLPGYNFTTGQDHNITLMAILENSQPYYLINPNTNQPGGTINCAMSAQTATNTATNTSTPVSAPSTTQTPTNTLTNTVTPTITNTISPTSTSTSTSTWTSTPTKTATPTQTRTVTKTATQTTMPGSVTSTPKPIYPYDLKHTGNFGTQTLSNCRAIGYAKKINAGTGTVYIRIYVDGALVSGRYTARGGSFNFDLLSLPRFAFSTGQNHTVVLMAILENSQPYYLINPSSNQPGGVINCQ